MPRNPACTRCPAHQGVRHVCLWGAGEMGGTLFVGESPGPEEDKLGVPFIGPSGQLLRRHFPSLRAYYTNAQKCAGTPTITNIRACWEYLEEEIRSSSWERIVAVGAWASRILAEKGIPHERIDHPAAVLRGRVSFTEWIATHATRRPLPARYDYAWTGELDDGPVAVDVETTNRPGGELGPFLHPGLPVPWFEPSSLVCVGFAQGDRRWTLWATQREEIQFILESPCPKIFHNALYDLVWLMHEGYEVRGPIHDTMWLLALADESASRDLKEVSPYVYDENTPVRCADRDLVACYCANDAASTLGLWMDPRYAVYRDHMVYQMYQRMAPRLARMSLDGIPVFEDAVWAAYETASRESARCQEILDSLAEQMGKEKVNWDSGDQVADLLHPWLPARRTPSGKRRSVDEDALRQCDHPIARLLLQKRGLDKLRRTTLAPLLGKRTAHGLVILNQAATGRTASQRMNLQNIPREFEEVRSGDSEETEGGIPENIRVLFGHPDMEWVKVDFVAAELIVVGVEAGCRRLIEWYTQGRDIHAETAARILGKRPEDVTPEERKRLGKVPNFLLCYGGGTSTLIRRARTEYGVHLTRAEAEEIITEWFRVFPEIALWHDKVRLDILYRREVTSPLGRHRSIPLAHRHSLNMALNAPIQGTVSDLLLLGLDRTYPWPGRLVNVVHDEADFLIPAGSFDRCAWERFAGTVARVVPRYPMRVEVSRGSSWGTTETVFVTNGEEAPPVVGAAAAGAADR